MAPSIRHLGRQLHRLKDNPEEKVFSKAWEQQNKQNLTLRYLLDPENGQPRVEPPPEVSQEVATAVATTIQWLGSPVGQAWLESLGYRRSP